MAKEVYIPKLGQTVEEVKLLRWLVPDGAQIEEGDGVLEVETDKANFTVESTTRGFVHRGPFQEGEVLPVLTVVAVVSKQDETFGKGAKELAKDVPDAPETPVAQDSRTAVAEKTTGRGEDVFASPRARRLAAAKQVDLAQVAPTGYGGERVVERDIVAYLNQRPMVTPIAQKVAAESGVDLRAVSGTGVRGRVTKEDVERATRDEKRKPEVEGVQVPGLASVVPPPAEVVERIPLQGIRGIIASRMGTSVHTTARVTLFMEADASQLVEMRTRLKAKVEAEWGFAPGYNDLLAKMTASAIRQHPYMNARLTPDAIERLAHVNLGMAVDTDRGLLVPVIRDADKKSLREFGMEFRELAGRAQKGKAMPDDLAGGTFTLTNLGMYDVLAFTPVINMPEAAILGIGAITPQAVVRDGQVQVREMTILSLVFDHRLVDGAPAARFLKTIKDLIEEPYLWLAL